MEVAFVRLKFEHVDFHPWLDECGFFWGIVSTVCYVCHFLCTGCLCVCWQIFAIVCIKLKQILHLQDVPNKLSETVRLLVYSSFIVKKTGYMSHYQPLHCYKQFNVSRHCTILCSIGSYEPPSCLLWSVTNSIALHGHHVSHPLTTNNGGTWKTWSTGRNCRKGNSHGESWNQLTA
jgi:hypothetical protein